MLISRRTFIRQILILALGLLLEMFGFKPKKEPPSNYYKFEVGKSQLRILPGESFKATINWSTSEAVVDTTKNQSIDIAGTWNKRPSVPSIKMYYYSIQKPDGMSDEEFKKIVAESMHESEEDVTA